MQARSDKPTAEEEVLIIATSFTQKEHSMPTAIRKNGIARVMEEAITRQRDGTSEDSVPR